MARRRSTKDLVAIKALTKAHLRETNALANVQLERLILSSAQSPSVVQLFFSFASKANVYMVMEYMPRGDCHALLEQLGFFEEDLASFYLAETIEGARAKHAPRAARLPRAPSIAPRRDRLLPTLPPDCRAYCAPRAACAQRRAARRAASAAIVPPLCAPAR